MWSPKPNKEKKRNTIPLPSLYVLPPRWGQWGRNPVYVLIIWSSAAGPPPSTPSTSFFAFLCCLHVQGESEISPRPIIHSKFGFLLPGVPFMEQSWLQVLFSVASQVTCLWVQLKSWINKYHCHGHWSPGWSFNEPEAVVMDWLDLVLVMREGSVLERGSGGIGLGVTQRVVGRRQRNLHEVATRSGSICGRWEAHRYYAATWVGRRKWC